MRSPNSRFSGVQSTHFPLAECEPNIRAIASVFKAIAHSRKIAHASVTAATHVRVMKAARTRLQS